MDFEPWAHLFSFGRRASRKRPANGLGEESISAKAQRLRLAASFVLSAWSSVFEPFVPQALPTGPQRIDIDAADFGCAAGTGDLAARAFEHVAQVRLLHLFESERSLRGLPLASALRHAISIRSESRFWYRRQCEKRPRNERLGRCGSCLFVIVAVLEEIYRFGLKHECAGNHVLEFTDVPGPGSAGVSLKYAF